MPSPHIDSYRFGRIVIDGHSYDKDVIILPDRVIPNWWRQSGHSLIEADLDPIFENPPEVLVIGQGAYSRMKVPSDTERALREAGIEVKAFPSDKAVERYNQLSQEKQVAAALHLTC